MTRAGWVEVGRWLYCVGQHGGVQTGGRCAPGCDGCAASAGVAADWRSRVCVVCRRVLAEAEATVDAAGAWRCAECAARKRLVDARESIVASARRNPWQVTAEQIARAAADRRARWRVEGARCPLCGEARRCRCTARELAVFAARQVELPGLGSTGPIMPATPGAQGRLF